MSYGTVLMRLEALRGLPEPCLRRVDQYAQPEPRAQRALWRALRYLTDLHVEIEWARQQIRVAPDAEARYQIFRGLSRDMQVDLWVAGIDVLNASEEQAFRQRVAQDEELYCIMVSHTRLWEVEDAASSDDDDDYYLCGVEGVCPQVRKDVIYPAAVEYLCSLCPLPDRPFPLAHDAEGWETFLGDKR